MEKIKSTAMMTVMVSFNHFVMTKNERQFKINESLRSKKKYSVEMKCQFKPIYIKMTSKMA